MSKNEIVASTYTPAKIPQWILNIQLHLDTAFSAWTVKNPSLNHRLSRSAIFFSCALVTSFLPKGNLLLNGLLILLIWILLALLPKKIPYWIPLLFIMFNIGWLYYIMQLFVPYY